MINYYPAEVRSTNSRSEKAECLNRVASLVGGKFFIADTTRGSLLLLKRRLLTRFSIRQLKIEASSAGEAAKGWLRVEQPEGLDGDQTLGNGVFDLDC